MKRLVLLLAATPALFWAQEEGAAVNVSESAPKSAYTELYFKDGSGNHEYTCFARALQPTATFSINASTLTSIVDLANTSTVTTVSAHGLSVGNAVTITGASDTDLNATFYVQTVGSTTTFTITTASVSDATYNAAGLQFTTAAPRTTEAIWAIIKYSYDGANFGTRKQWASGGTQYKHICDNRAVTTGSTKITYY